MRWAIYVLVLVVVIGLLHLWIKNKSYVFDQDAIFDITRKAIKKLNTTGIVVLYCLAVQYAFFLQVKRLMWKYMKKLLKTWRLNIPVTLFRSVTGSGYSSTRVDGWPRFILCTRPLRSMCISWARPCIRPDMQVGIVG